MLTHYLLKFCQGIDNYNYFKAKLNLISQIRYKIIANWFLINKTVLYVWTSNKYNTYLLFKDHGFVCCYIGYL